MMTTLAEIRADWERGQRVVFEYTIHDGYVPVACIVVVEREGYRILRYFPIAGNWMCSVDFDRCNSSEVIENLSKVLNNES